MNNPHDHTSESPPRKPAYARVPPHEAEIWVGTIYRLLGRSRDEMDLSEACAIADDVVQEFKKRFP